MMRGEMQSILIFVSLIISVSQSKPGTECCKTILFDSMDEEHHDRVGNRLGFYQQFGQYGARPAYKQMGGDFFFFFDEDKDVWTETKYFFGATLFSRFENDNTNYCLESYDNWYLYNGTEMVWSEQMKTSCLSIEEYCCRNIKLSSTNVNMTDSENQTLYQTNALASLGEYYAIGMKGGRWVYQKKYEDRYLEYGDRYWLGNTGVGKTSGHIHQDGGSICPESIKGEWQISTKSKDGDWSWKTDLGLEVTCLETKSEDGSEQSSHHPPGKLSHMFQPFRSEEDPGYYSSAVAFGVMTMILAVLLVLFLGRRFKTAWARGAQGKRLVTETLEL